MSLIRLLSSPSLPRPLSALPFTSPFSYLIIHIHRVIRGTYVARRVSAGAHHAPVLAKLQVKTFVLHISEERSSSRATPGAGRDPAALSPSSGKRQEGEARTRRTRAIAIYYIYIGPRNNERRETTTGDLVGGIESLETSIADTEWFGFLPRVTNERIRIRGGL